MGKAPHPPPQLSLTHTWLFCLEEARKLNYCIFAIMENSFQDAESVVKYKLYA